MLKGKSRQAFRVQGSRVLGLRAAEEGNLDRCSDSRRVT